VLIYREATVATDTIDAARLAGVGSLGNIQEHRQ
jgi:hypothetical protein